MQSQSNRQRALHIIKAALTFGINPSLEPMRHITALLDNPEEHFSCIQVAGTNGKSSTSRYLAAILRSQGYSVGLYTSPELVHISERIEVDGCVISEESFAEAIIQVHATATGAGLSLTEFELLTACALWYFARSNVDYAVLEVGLGGRWDATSVVVPQMAVLTGVDLDHTTILGDTISQIAEEKAAIIKPNTLVVAAPTNPAALEVFRQHAASQEAPYAEVPVQTREEEGSYQAQNKLTALTAARILLNTEFFIEQSAAEALASTVIPGRLEVLCTSPLLVIDAAHNPASAKLLADTFKLPDAVLLLGILKDKDAQGIICALAPHFAHIAVTQSESPRAIPANELAELVKELAGNTPELYVTPQKALETLLKQNHPILVTGSITLAGTVKQALMQP